MTKKHFRMLAKGFHEAFTGFHLDPLNFEDTTRVEGFKLWLSMVEDVADVCAQVNPNFNREKFLTACREGL